MFCEDCVFEYLRHESDRLSNRERVRWLYRQEAIQRQATNNPFRCSECGQEGAREWVYVVPGKAQRTVGRCYACLYSGFRNTALMSAAQITDPAARLQAMVAAMETAKRQARYVLDLIWA